MVERVGTSTASRHVASPVWCADTTLALLPDGKLNWAAPGTL